MSVTLAHLERETARRVGPFQWWPSDPQSPSTARTTFVNVPALQTTVDQDTVSNLYLLRRGQLENGTTVPVSSFDRQRSIALLDPTGGQVVVDRPWQVPPAPSELLEFHHLDPTQELAPAVQAGLRRCRLEERVMLAPGFYYECDLTEAIPWITTVQQVRKIEASPYPSGWPGWWGGPLSLPFTVFMECGHVWIRLAGSVYWGPYWGGILLTLTRSETDWTSCSDTEDLDVDLDWAAAAGHIEAWHLFPAKLQAAAAGGLQATQQMAAAEFTRQAQVHQPVRKDLFAFDRTFGWSLNRRWGWAGYGGGSVVNAPVGNW